MVKATYTTPAVADMSGGPNSPSSNYLTPNNRLNFQLPMKSRPNIVNGEIIASTRIQVT